MLNKYLFVEIVQAEVKPKKERKKGSYVMTPEHKEKLRLAREIKKREKNGL